MKTTIKNVMNTILVVTLLIPMVSACAQQRMKASKTYITKDVKVSEFNAIELLGSPDVVYTQSSDGQTTVQVYGSDNLVDLLDIQVKNKTLTVKFKPNVS